VLPHRLEAVLVLAALAVGAKEYAAVELADLD
jgi:hypothetical protein